MTLSGAAVRLTVMVGESDTHRHKPVFTEIVHRERVEAFLPQLEDLEIEDLITLEPCEVVRSVGRSGDA